MKIFEVKENKKAYIDLLLFIDNYDHPIIECGKQLCDMVYLEKKI